MIWALVLLLLLLAVGGGVFSPSSCSSCSSSHCCSPCSARGRPSRAESHTMTRLGGVTPLSRGVETVKLARAKSPFRPNSSRRSRSAAAGVAHPRPTRTWRSDRWLGWEGAVSCDPSRRARVDDPPPRAGGAASTRGRARARRPASPTHARTSGATSPAPGGAGTSIRSRRKRSSCSREHSPCISATRPSGGRTHAWTHPRGAGNTPADREPRRRGAGRLRLRDAARDGAIHAPRPRRGLDQARRSTVSRSITTV